MHGIHSKRAKNLLFFLLSTWHAHKRPRKRVAVKVSEAA
jgi:hypothetical protein